MRLFILGGGTLRGTFAGKLDYCRLKINLSKYTIKIITLLYIFHTIP